MSIALAAWALASSEASAQAPHPIPPPVRSLHERVADAERIAIGVATRVDAGRIRIAGVVALRGALPSELELKRSPLRPPPLAVGERALLFLRGDRSPFIFAGEPGELVPIADAGDARALAQAFPSLLAAGRDPTALAPVYASWAKSGSRLLRALGHEGLAALPLKPAAGESPPQQ